jgi:hypothetical protein
VVDSGDLDHEGLPIWPNYTRALAQEHMRE